MRQPEPIILASSRHRRMPWKNGGGETVEVAVYPEGSDLAGFGWRVSMATVASDGPFSSFPGVDRTLAVLSGDGMELEIDGMGRQVLGPHGAPLAFPADAPTFARLTGGPITDLNVMIGSITHTFDGDLTIDLIGPDDTTVQLVNHRGGGGDNFTNTVFDDEALTSIAAGSPPFTGSFIPEQPLSNFDGKSPNGLWRLRVRDTVSQDTGSINAWSLDPSPRCG